MEGELSWQKRKRATGDGEGEKESGVEDMETAVAGSEEQKRKRATGDGEGKEESGVEDTETAVAGSEEFEMRTQRIFKKIDQFTKQFLEVLEAGNTLFRELRSEFEELGINMHKDLAEEWQEDIKDLRALKAAGEASRALLQNAQHHIVRDVSEDA